jgi:hypothetical protein
MTVKELERCRKWGLPSLRHYPNILLDRLRAKIKMSSQFNWCHNQNSERALPKYKSEIIRLQPTCPEFRMAEDYKFI